jgi:4-oxalmesaconate hydratase
MIIDAHGHYTTVPAGLRVFRALQISAMGKPVKSAVRISDDEIRASLEGGQIRLLDERGIDVMLFSPMASAMGHHFGNALISRYWTEVNNELIHRVCALYPDRFIGVCSLPQSPGVSPRDCVEELTRCITEFGFVGCNLNPDPSGGYWADPPLGDRWWYPLYEQLEALDVPAMIHASATCSPALHTTGSHYLNVDSTAFLQLMDSRVFTDFPKLRFIMPHGGGNVPYQSARYRALSIMNKWEPFEQFVKRFYFDTTVYSPDAMELLVKVVGVDNVLFASEMLGGVNAVDPQTGRAFDDNRPSLDAIPWLSATDRKKILEENVRNAYPRVGPILERRPKSKAAGV